MRKCTGQPMLSGYIFIEHVKETCCSDNHITFLFEWMIWLSFSLGQQAFSGNRARHRSPSPLLLHLL